MASGVEVAGLVLGSFPIILNCLDYYRQGFEPLEEWWNFRTHFIAFVDDIRHQMMRYNGNMVRLLDPIITDSEELAILVRQPEDPRWEDGSLNVALEQRLASERGRFFRIVYRMHDVVEDLKKLLQIKNGQVSWTGSTQQRSWEWHLTRVRISFSKGKHRKVKKLAAHNQELEDILGYSERIIPIADGRKSSEPVALFEKIRQHACCIHTVLKRHWKCDGQKCQLHRAHLSIHARTQTPNLKMLFVMEGDINSQKQEVVFQRVDEKGPETSTMLTPVSYVQQSSSFEAVQHSFEEGSSKGRFSFRSLVSKPQKKTPDALLCDSNSRHLLENKKNVTFQAPTPVISVTQVHPAIKPYFIPDLCSFLWTDEHPKHELIFHQSEYPFEISKSFEATSIDVAKLVPLPHLLDSHYQTRMDIPRQNRFAMASHLASALLQTHTSSWLGARWSKQDFYFLADSHTLSSTHPYVSQTYTSKMANTAEDITYCTDSAHYPPPSEEDTRASLFTVGVMILELIFGYNIECCPFREHYYGLDHRPNDQTDMSTARKWATKVLGECGADIADVVRRCLDCSFGPRPSFADRRFREAVYEGVIRPLADYTKIWPDVSP